MAGSKAPANAQGAVAPSTRPQSPSARPQAKATVLGPSVAPPKPAAKGKPAIATVLGTGTPNIAPPSAAQLPSLDALTSHAPPPQTQPDKRAGIASARPTIAQGPATPSVRAVQGVPISPYPPGPEGRPAPRVLPPTPAPRDASEMPTVQTNPPADYRERMRMDPARMVQALPELSADTRGIPEVTGTVVDEQRFTSAENVPLPPREYLPGDPMNPMSSSQPPAAGVRSRRPREMPFAPEEKQGDQLSYILLYWAVCIAVVVAVGVLAFRIL